MRGERLLIALLTAVNFTHILDFVILMPLGPQLMRVFGITPTQFAAAVSAYTFSSAIAGLLAALVIDRFDRKRALLAMYAGFMLATAACALAPGFATLVAARIAAGAFGGVLGTLVLAIIADQIPYERRGQATGVVMAAFSLASIAGVPLALWASVRWSWHAPFILLTALSAAVLVAAMLALRPMRAHLDRPHVPVATLLALVRTPSTWRALGFSAMLMLAGFTVIPFISPYLVANVGFTESDLPLIYFFGGICGVLTQPWIGRLADRHGKHRVFTIVAALSIGPILALTHLPEVSKPTAYLVTTLFVVLGSGRFVPAMAMVSSSVPPHQRGAFMSLNGSVQSAASGAAAWLAGAMISGHDGRITGYDRVGLVAAAATVACLVLARGVRVASGPAAGAAVPPAAPAPGATDAR